MFNTEEEKQEAVKESRTDAEEQYPRLEEMLNKYFVDVLRDDDATFYAGFCVFAYRKEADWSISLEYADKRFQVKVRKGHYMAKLERFHRPANLFIHEYHDNLFLTYFPDYLKFENQYNEDRNIDVFLEKLIKVFG